LKFANQVAPEGDLFSLENYPDMLQSNYNFGFIFYAGLSASTRCRPGFRLSCRACVQMPAFKLKTPRWQGKFKLTPLEIGALLSRGNSRLAVTLNTCKAP